MTAVFPRRDLLRAGVALAAFGSVPACVRAAGGDAWARADAIVRALREPAIPARRFDITAFGAVGDGTTDATDAIARAIAACAAAGGGQVVVPPGRFLTGAITLRSRIALHVSEGATLAFSTDPADYPRVFTRWEGVELMNYSPLIYAHRCHDVAITGGGTIDGQASAETWWSWSSGAKFGWREGMPDQRAARTRLLAMAEAGVPVAERIFGDGDYLRPPLVQFYDCDRVLVEGVTLRDSPLWNLHPVLCRDVTMRGVTVTGAGPNNDGCDPESVDRMLIERCTFDTGDDCIAIKSGRNADGRRLATPATNIVIRDCTMKAGHGGVVIGSEISGGASAIFAERCRMDSPDLWYALRIKNNAMRGGIVEDVHVRDIAIGTVERAAITCDFNYEEGANGPFVPVLRNLSIERMTATNAVRVADIQGLAGAPVRDIALVDCAFDGVREDSIVAHAEQLTLDRVRVNGRRVASL